MKLRAAILLPALIVSCYATNSANAEWQSEPTTVFGIELGEPISSKIPVCPPTNYYDGSRKEFCKEDKLYSIRGLAVIKFDKIPMEGILKKITAFVYDGVVLSIQAETFDNNYQQLRLALIEKYGQPTITKKESLKTKAGVDWESEILTWSGKNVSIQLHERFDTINSSAMIVSHLPTMAIREKEKENSAKKAASEL